MKILIELKQEDFNRLKDIMSDLNIQYTHPEIEDGEVDEWEDYSNWE